MKQRKLITLSREVIDDIDRVSKDEDFNFSAWVEEMWIEHKMSESGLRHLQGFHEKMAKKYKNKRYYSAKKCHILAEKLSKEQKSQLLSSRKIICKKAEYFYGQLRIWNNKFPNFKITALQFKELLGLDLLEDR